MRRALISLAIAVAIVVAAFPEVIFMGGSLSPVGLNPVVNRAAPHHVVKLYPNLHGREPAANVRDVGAVISLVTLVLLAAGAVVGATRSRHSRRVTPAVTGAGC